MPRRLTIAPAARRDLRGVRIWLSQPGSGQFAHRRLAAIERAVLELAGDPCRYAFGAHSGIRARYVERHAILYRVSPDTGDSSTAGNVVVLRVFGPGQSRDRV
jgi:plasmid stabilization system protein ParE